jgi:hypothetical protein
MSPNDPTRSSNDPIWQQIYEDSDEVRMIMEMDREFLRQELYEEQLREERFFEAGLHADDYDVITDRD